MSRPLGVPRPSREQIRHGLDVARLRAPLALPTLIVGVGGGVIGAAYLWALRELTELIGPGERSVLPQALILVAVGITVTLIERSLGDTGNVELLVDNIHVLGGAEDIKRVRPLVPSSLLCIAAGGGMGPEAPLVQANGSFGTWVASKLHLASQDMRVISITGMAAGFSVLFGAPLGAALFSLEILHKRGLQYYEALVPAMAGALIGHAMNFGLTKIGLDPFWHLPAIGRLDGGDLAWGLACGVLGAVGALIFTGLVAGARHALSRVPAVALPALAGLLLGGLYWWSPYALTNGEVQVNTILATRLTTGALAIAILAKLAGVIVTLSGRWKGGFIIPLFFIGIVAGQLIHQLVPSTNVTVLMVSLAVALCVGVTKTPMGSTLVVTEMAGLALLPMALTAAVVALVLTSQATVIDTQRARAPVGSA